MNKKKKKNKIEKNTFKEHNCVRICMQNFRNATHDCEPSRQYRESTYISIRVEATANTSVRNIDDRIEINSKMTTNHKERKLKQTKLSV